MRECVDLGIDHVWMHRAFGEASVSVIDLADSHSIYYYNVIVQARMDDRSHRHRRSTIRSVGRGHIDGKSLATEKAKALAGPKTGGVGLRWRSPVSRLRLRSIEPWIQPFQISQPSQADVARDGRHELS